MSFPLSRQLLSISAIFCLFMVGCGNPRSDGAPSGHRTYAHDSQSDQLEDQSNDSPHLPSRPKNRPLPVMPEGIDEETEGHDDQDPEVISGNDIPYFRSKSQSNLQTDPDDESTVPEFSAGPSTSEKPATTLDHLTPTAPASSERPSPTLSPKPSTTPVTLAPPSQPRQAPRTQEKATASPPTSQSNSQSNSLPAVPPAISQPNSPQSSRSASRAATVQVLPQSARPRAGNGAPTRSNRTNPIPTPSPLSPVEVRPSARIVRPNPSNVKPPIRRGDTPPERFGTETLPHFSPSTFVNWSNSVWMFLVNAFYPSHFLEGMPTTDRLASKGLPNRGQLINGFQLAVSGIGFVADPLVRHSQFGSYEMVGAAIPFIGAKTLQGFLNIEAKKPEHDRIPQPYTEIIIRYCSAKMGGPLGQHVSHQNGRDCDFLYPRYDDQDTKKIVTLVGRVNRLSDNFDHQLMILLAEAALEFGAQSILVNSAVKEELCLRYPNSPAHQILARFTGHFNTGHIRLKCPTNAPKSYCENIPHRPARATCPRPSNNTSVGNG